MTPAALVIGPLLLAAVFLASGVGKALRPEAAAETIAVLLGSQTPPSAPVAALVLVEFLLAAWLVSGLAPKAALGGTIVTLLGFSTALGALLIVKPSNPCGCGLPAFSTNAVVDNGIGLARNLLLICVGVLAWPSDGLPHSKEK